VVTKGSNLPPAVLDMTMNMLCEVCDAEGEELFAHLAALINVMANMDTNARKLMMAFLQTNPTLKAGPDGVWLLLGGLGRSTN